MEILILSTFLKLGLAKPLEENFLASRESEGQFEYGNYNKEADDLHSVVQYFSGVKRVIGGIIGHSKGKLTICFLCRSKT